MAVPAPSANQQTVGNIGLFYVCYKLSRLGWNVMPTARNARGIDILIYSQDATRKHSIQVKTLSKGSPVPLGTKLDHLFADFVVVCRHVIREIPECFVLEPGEVRKLAHCGKKDGKVSFWLQPRAYGTDKFRDNWDRIGSGLSPSLPESPNVPKRFVASIGGYMGPSYKVDLRNGKLMHTASGVGYRDPTLSEVEPTAAQWRAFRKALDDLNVWQWQAEYRSDGIVDGTHWCFDIVYPDREHKSDGSNGYPTPIRVFRRYLAAVKKLTGGKEFK